ncbi:MAG: DUF4431 domain-containing protein [Methyloceanibacter sp.]
MRLLLPIALTLLVLAPASAYAVCLQAEQATTIIEGVLSEGTFKDANDQPEQAFILTPLVPTCLAGDENIDEKEQVGEIQIFSTNDKVAQSIKNFVGKDVFVQGAPFGAHTAHHHAPIVMDISGIQVN